jgi:hypothetical protein
MPADRTPVLLTDRRPGATLRFEAGPMGGAALVVDLSPRLLTRYEVEVLAGLYFPYLEVDHAQQIAWRESAFETSAWNNNPGVEDSRGLYQINLLAWPQCRGWNLWDPQVCSYWAGWIFHQFGWRPWKAATPPYFPWQ